MSEGRPIAVVLLSGGMDSCVVTAEARAKGLELALFHANYGQRTEPMELACFHAIADRFEIPRTRRLVADMRYLGLIGGSSLTDRSLPVDVSPLVSSRSIPTSYVPFRNAHFLAVAVSWGETLGAGSIHIGAVEEDSSGYPDCREAYYRAFANVVELGTRPGTSLEIVTPLIHLDKAAIVRRGLDLGAPFELTWSCYSESEVACGVCDSCRRRLRGFARAGAVDPIPYVERSP